MVVYLKALRATDLEEEGLLLFVLFVQASLVGPTKTNSY
jgi:hypothetical protein